MKQLATVVAIYYSDGDNLSYPKKPALFKFDSSLIKIGNSPSWESFNKTESPYLFVPRENDVYEGKNDKILFIEKEKMSIQKENFIAVYEDGHVERLKYEQAKVIWEETNKN
jgi:hypothetical protein